MFCMLRKRVKFSYLFECKNIKNKIFPCKEMEPLIEYFRNRQDLPPSGHGDYVFYSALDLVIKRIKWSLWQTYADLPHFF
jgi:hypothetical protein